MRKLFFTLSTCLLTFGVLAGACTGFGGPPDPASELELVVQSQAADSKKPNSEKTKPEKTSADTTDRPRAHQAHEDASPEKPKDLRVAVISDLNSSYGSTAYNDEVHQAVEWLVDDVEPDVVISTGDMVAGQRQGLDYEAMWTGFHDAVTTPLANADIPLMVTPGNHDASAGSFYLDERITFVEQWKRKRPDVDFVDDTMYPLYYAFEIGPALFVSLDATITGPIDAEQRRWLDDLLSKHAHKRAKIVFGHVPLHPFSEERRGEVLGDDKLETLLFEHGVDLMISGHHHAYYPGRRQKLRLLSMACLGSGQRTLIGTDQKSKKSVALLDISPRGDITLDAFDALDHTKIERHTLPEYLNSGKRRIWRDDVGQRTTN